MPTGNDVYTNDEFEMRRGGTCTGVFLVEVGECRIIAQPYDLVGRRESKEAAAVDHPKLELLSRQRRVAVQIVEGEVRADIPRVAQKDMVL